MKHTYLVKVFLYGPYLPEENQIIKNFELLQEIYSDNSGWESGPSGLRADPSENDVLITLEYKVEPKQCPEVILKISTESLSSRVAKGLAESEAKKICSILSLSVQGCRYLYKMGKVKMLPDPEAKNNTESPLSDPVLGISYPKKKILDEQVAFLKEVAEKASQDENLEKALEFFNTGLQAEFNSSVTDEKAVLAFFKIIEILVPKISEKYKKSEDKGKQYSETIDKLTKKLSTGESAKRKLKYLRETFTEIKRIDGSILSETIKDVAKIFGLNQAGVARISKLIEVRNEVIAHPGIRDKMDQNKKLEDDRDFREVAKIFILEYLNRMLSVDISNIKKIEGQKEIGNWYAVSYTKSSS